MIILNGMGRVIGCSSSEKDAFCLECPQKKRKYCLMKGIKVRLWKGMSLNKEGITRIATWKTE